MHFFSREKKRIVLVSGKVVHQFDIHKDCGWCGRRLNKDYRYSAYFDFNGSEERLRRDYKAKSELGDYVYINCSLAVSWHFHGRCANELHGKVIAPIDDF